MSAATARVVLQSRALKCSFTSVFHIQKTGNTCRAIREAKEFETIFLKAVGAPMAIMGIIGGVTMFLKDG